MRNDTTMATTLATAPAQAAPRQKASARRSFSSSGLGAAATGAAAAAWRWFSTALAMRFQTLALGASLGCSSVRDASRSCQIRACARTVTFSRATASKRRRAPPRSVPSA